MVCCGGDRAKVACGCSAVLVWQPARSQGAPGTLALPPNPPYLTSCYIPSYLHPPQQPTPQIRHRALSTATGSTASLATRLPARATGPAGTVRIPRSPSSQPHAGRHLVLIFTPLSPIQAQRRSSSALAGCFTTRRPTPATGPRMWPAARSIVSISSRHLSPLPRKAAERFKHCIAQSGLP